MTKIDCEGLNAFESHNFPTLAEFRTNIQGEENRLDRFCSSRRSEEFFSQMGSDLRHVGRRTFQCSYESQPKRFVAPRLSRHHVFNDATISRTADPRRRPANVRCWKSAHESAGSDRRAAQSDGTRRADRQLYSVLQRKRPLRVRKRHLVAEGRRLFRFRYDDRSRADESNERSTKICIVFFCSCPICSAKIRWISKRKNRN